MRSNSSTGMVGSSPAKTSWSGGPPRTFGKASWVQSGENVPASLPEP